jgi:ADP-ribosyl-[dinitrogen reductase] hydrolase
MPRTRVELQDRFRASVLGFAIGDALGFPFRGLPPAAMARQPFLGEDFAARPRGGFAKGQFSDDTQMLLAVADAVVRQRRVDGRAAAQHLGWLWQEGTILQPTPATTQAVEALLAGTPWMSAGAPLGVKDPSCLSRGVVAGLVSEPAPPRLAHHAQVLTVMTHKDPACTAAVAVVGRALQLGLEGESLEPQVCCERLAQAAAPADPELADEVFYLPRVLSWDPQRALAALRRVGVPPGAHDFEHGLPPHVVPVLLTALFASFHAPRDFRQAVALVLSGGGEVDVAAGVTGAILGAQLGTEGLPPRLKKHVLYAEALVHTADALFGLTEVLTPALAPARVRSQR